MQKKGAVLARARAAAEVAKRAHYYEGQQNELNGILSEMAEHERQRAIAIEQGDCDREEARAAELSEPDLASLSAEIEAY